MCSIQGVEDMDQNPRVSCSSNETCVCCSSNETHRHHASVMWISIQLCPSGCRELCCATLCLHCIVRSHGTGEACSHWQIMEQYKSLNSLMGTAECKSTELMLEACMFHCCLCQYPTSSTLLYFCMCSNARRGPTPM